MKYLFVDGAMFLQLVEAGRSYAGRQANGPVNFNLVSDRYDRAFFYDAYPAKKPNQSEEDFNKQIDLKQKLFRSVNFSKGFHTRTGESRVRASAGGQQQKGVDIMMALDIYRHAVSGNISEAHIMASDLDFFPVLESLKDTPVKSVLHCNKKKTSEDLMSLADEVVPMNAFNVGLWCEEPYDSLVEQCSLNTLGGIHLLKTGRFKGAAFSLMRFDGEHGPTYGVHISNWNSGNVFHATEDYVAMDYVESRLRGLILLD